MKFPAVTFLLLSVSAPLPSIASHRPVTTPGTRLVYVFIPSSCPHPELSGQWSRVPASWAPGDNVSRNHINCDKRLNLHHTCFPTSAPRGENWPGKGRSDCI